MIRISPFLPLLVFGCQSGGTLRPPQDENPSRDPQTHISNTSSDLTAEKPAVRPRSPVQVRHLYSPTLALDTGGRLQCRRGEDCATLQGLAPTLSARQAGILPDGRVLNADLRNPVSLPQKFRLPAIGVSDLGFAVQDSDGSVWCVFGCLGNEEVVDGYFKWYGPMPSPVFSSFGQAQRFGCGIEKQTSHLWCWLSYDRTSAPARVEKLGEVKGLAVGAEHICIRDKLNRVTCWGDASYGEVGFIAERSYEYGFDLAHGIERFVQSKPRSVFLDLPAPAKEVYAAGYMSCAWLENDELWCWGNTGKLHFRDLNGPESFKSRMTTGVDAKSLPIYKPTFASTLPSSPMKMPENCTPKDITVWTQICVVCDSGCAQCWGYNENDALGYGDSKESWAPRNECLEF